MSAAIPLSRLQRHHGHNYQERKRYLDAVQLHHRPVLAIAHHSCLYYLSESCFLKQEKTNKSLESEIEIIINITIALVYIVYF